MQRVQIKGVVFCVLIVIEQDILISEGSLLNSPWGNESEEDDYTKDENAGDSNRGEVASVEEIQDIETN